MRIIRYKNNTRDPQYGWIKGEEVGLIHGEIFSRYQRGEAVLPLSSLELLPPVAPGKIICVGRNYAAHAEEHGADVPELPLIFFKPPSSLIGQGETIFLPPQSSQVEHEAELAVVIGKGGRWIEPDDVKDHIFGYTIANDITARDLQQVDGQWTRAKGFDTFCPVGPWIDTELDPSDVLITCRVNGNMRQMASTRDLVFSIQQLLAYISSIMTLEPGDLLLTGTPAGVGPLEPGDELETTIKGIGSLFNTVSPETERY
jgi:2-keto-4-pentenoate hydratase/2-oxohepta-3-ene-1,7-dioic acid hydratase in catechol pathway